MYTRIRQITILLLLILLLTTLAACGQSQQANQPKVAPSPTATSRPPTPTPTPTLTPSPTPKPTPTPGPRPAPPPKPTPKPTPVSSQPGAPPAPLTSGKVILVDLSAQRLYTYKDGVFVFSNAVESGRPQLPTPTGTYYIQAKSRGIYFHSPWPVDSPYYYEPTFINYAMQFRSDGFFLHDAWWHVKFGPGGNVPHQLPDGSWETGSHGCVGMTVASASRLYYWVNIGTPVIIRY